MRKFCFPTSSKNGSLLELGQSFLVIVLSCGLGLWYAEGFRTYGH